MSAYKIVAQTGGDFTIQIDSGNVLQCSSNTQATASVINGKVRVLTFYPYFEATVDLTSNTILINTIDVTANGATSIANQLNQTVFIGGGGSTTTDASQLTAGTLPDARLSSKVLNATKFTANSRIVFIGDSITANGIGTSTNYIQYQNFGFAAWTLFKAGNYYMPKGGNLGVGGETSTQILARIGAVKNYQPRITVVLCGTNDPLYSISQATTIANLRKIYDAIINFGSKVVAITILPRYSPNAYSAPNETARLAINAWMLTQSDITVVDAEATMTGTGNFEADGLHPSPTGAYNLGNLVASAINPFITISNPSNVLTDDNAFSANPQMTGTTGTLSTATGTVATSWQLNSSSAGGATVVGSKTTDANGKDQQIITISGTYTGSSRSIFLSNTAATPGSIVTGDIIEGLSDIEITGALSSNIRSVYVSVKMQTGDSVTTLAEVISMYPTSTGTLNMPLGTYSLKTPSIAVASGTVGIITTRLYITLATTGTTDVVSGTIKISGLGGRKVPVDAEPLNATNLPQVGNLALLSTTTKTSVVAAINENAAALPIKMNIGNDNGVKLLSILGSTIKAKTIGLDLSSATTTLAMPTGNMWYTPIYLDVAQTLTGVKVYQKTLGVYTPNNENRVGLYSYNSGTSTYTLVASSADNGTLWSTSTGTLTIPFSSTYAAAAGYYIIGVLYNSSAQTTAPGLIAGLATNSASGFDGIKLWGFVAATTLPASKTYAQLSYNSTMFLGAVY